MPVNWFNWIRRKIWSIWRREFSTKWRETLNSLLKTTLCFIDFNTICIALQSKNRFIYIRTCITQFFVFNVNIPLYNFSFCRSFFILLLLYNVCTFMIPYFKQEYILHSLFLSAHTLTTVFLLLSYIHFIVLLL